MDNDLLATDVAGKNWDEILAYQIKYNSTYYLSYTRNPNQLGSINEASEKDKSLAISKSILDAVLEKFSDKRSLWKSVSGTKFLFNEEPSKGEIIYT